MVEPTFEAYYARQYNVGHDEARARIAFVEAIRPHFDAMRSIMRQRFAAHIDRAASENRKVDSLEAYVWRGRAAECEELTDAFEHHVEVLDSLTADWARQIKESQEER